MFRRGIERGVSTSEALGALRLVEAGLTYDQAAATLEIRGDNLRNIAKTRGLARPRRQGQSLRLRPAQLEWAHAEILSGRQYDDVGSDLEVDGTTLHHAFRRAGLSRPARNLEIPPLWLPENQVDVAYLAGLFDGEGCLSGTFCIYNCSVEVMQWLLQFGGRVYPRAPVGISRKVGYKWCIARGDYRVFLIAILPYLVIRRSAAFRWLEMN